GPGQVRLLLSLGDPAGPPLEGVVMASRLARFRGWSRKTFGPDAGPITRPVWDAKPGFVQLEDRSVPATFVVTNILDNQVDVVGGLSLRQAILSANANPGF